MTATRERDRAAVLQALEQWIKALDSGDLEALVACCDPEIIIANEKQPTKSGLQAIRDKFGPRMEQFSMESTIDVDRLSVHNDITIVVSQWTVKGTNKQSGQRRESGGRLLLNYRRNPNGEWKVLADIDNDEV